MTPKGRRAPPTGSTARGFTPTSRANPLPSRPRRRAGAGHQGSHARRPTAAQGATPGQRRSGATTADGGPGDAQIGRFSGSPDLPDLPRSRCAVGSPDSPSVRDTRGRCDWRLWHSGESGEPGGPGRQVTEWRLEKAQPRHGRAAARRGPGDGVSSPRAQYFRSTGVGRDLSDNTTRPARSASKRRTIRASAITPRLGERPATGSTRPGSNTCGAQPLWY